MQPVKDPELGLEETVGMIKTIFINHSEKSSVPKKAGALKKRLQDVDGKDGWAK